MSHRLLCSLACIGLAIGSVAASAQKPFQVESRWVIGGEGGWDYVLADPAKHRLYVTHMTKVDVVDTTTGKIIGAVSGLTRCHGVVLAADGKTGFVSDGGADDVVAFDTNTFATLAKSPAGGNPDGMTYEPATNTVWAFNGRSNNVTVIDASHMKALGNISLPGRPEFPQSDGKGLVFANIEDKNEIVRLDANAMKATAVWPLAGCDSPSGMAIDTEGGRLFSVCDGKVMIVTDDKTGKALATPAIGNGPDAAGYDAKDQLAFSSNGEGTLTVVDAGKPSYPVLQTVTTERGARTMTFDAGNGKIYLVTSKFAPADPANPKARPAQIPGTFTVLVVGR